VTELAAWSRSFTTVYLYDTLGDDSTEFITNHAEIAFLVCSADKAERVLALAPRCPKLRYLIVMGGGGSLLAAAVRCFVFCWFLGADLFSKKGRTFESDFVCRSAAHRSAGAGPGHASCERSSASSSC
jgi:hypothetical protein